MKNFGEKTKRWFKSLFVQTDGNEPKMLTFVKKEGTQTVISSILCALLGIFLGYLILVCINAENAGKAMATILKNFGYYTSPEKQLYYFGSTLVKSVPLIMCGLSVMFAYKAGLFNIGVGGQYCIGICFSLYAALVWQLPWYACIIVAALMGALWGALSGLFKALFNVNEVIACIMTNWISANIVTWVFTSTPNLKNISMGKSDYLITTAVTGNGTPKIGLDKLFKGSYIDLGIILAILVAIVLLIILNKTTFGYELKACGANKHAAKYAGMNEKRNIILSMAIAGTLAALGGALYYLNPGIEFRFGSAYGKLPDYGFNGIPVALLASSNPIGVIFSGIFLRYIAQGGNELTSAGYNKYVADIIIALIIYFAGFSKLLRDFITNRQKKITSKIQLKIAKDNAESALDEIEAEKEIENETIGESIKETVDETQDASPVNTDKKEIDD